jgi:hypothetical protein
LLPLMPPLPLPLMPLLPLQQLLQLLLLRLVLLHVVRTLPLRSPYATWFWFSPEDSYVYPNDNPPQSP